MNIGRTTKTTERGEGSQPASRGKRKNVAAGTSSGVGRGRGRNAAAGTSSGAGRGRSSAAGTSLGAGTSSGAGGRGFLWLLCGDDRSTEIPDLNAAPEA